MSINPDRKNVPLELLGAQGTDIPTFTKEAVLDPWQDKRRQRGERLRLVAAPNSGSGRGTIGELALRHLRLMVEHYSNSGESPSILEALSKRSGLTNGQIAVLCDMPLIDVRQQMDDLVNLGLVRAAHGELGIEFYVNNAEETLSAEPESQTQG